jgi:hypothetical protein
MPAAGQRNEKLTVEKRLAKNNSGSGETENKVVFLWSRIW